MVIALGLGVFFSIVIGCGLMALMFYSPAGLRRRDEAVRDDKHRQGAQRLRCAFGEQSFHRFRGQVEDDSTRNVVKDRLATSLPAHPSLTVSRSPSKWHRCRRLLQSRPC